MCRSAAAHELFTKRIFIACVIHVSVSSSAQELPSKSEISEAHARRVAHIESVQLSWEGTTIRMNGGAGDSEPDTPTSFKESGRMIVQGDSERVEH